MAATWVSSPQEVLSLVSRRPCTLEDIAAGLDLDVSEASRYVEQLAVAGLLETEYQGRWLYFRGSPLKAIERIRRRNAHRLPPRSPVMKRTVPGRRL